MNWSQALIDSVQDSVPPAVQKGLSELRRGDSNAVSKSVSLANEEATLLDEVKKHIKSGRVLGAEEEKALQVRADALIARRQNLCLQLDDHKERAAAVYNFVDAKISNIDESTKSVHRLLQEAIGGDGPDEKRRRKGADDISAVRDSNEPTYCICNQVSFGTMIGCDNDECPTEWFHLACVGLSEPRDPWFCPQCLGEEITGGGLTEVETESEGEGV